MIEAGCVIFGGMPWFKDPVVLREPVVPDGWKFFTADRSIGDRGRPEPVGRGAIREPPDLIRFPGRGLCTRKLEDRHRALQGGGLFFERLRHSHRGLFDERRVLLRHLVHLVDGKVDLFDAAALLFRCCCNFRRYRTRA